MPITTPDEVTYLMTSATEKVRELTREKNQERGSSKKFMFSMDTANAKANNKGITGPNCQCGATPQNSFTSI